MASLPCKQSCFLSACVAAIVALTFVGPMGVLAATTTAPLQVDLIQLVARPRTGAPIPVEVRCRWNGIALIQGQLEMEFRNGLQVLGRYRSAELALTTGEQRFRILLPSLPGNYEQQIMVGLAFVNARERIPLTEQILLVPSADERSLVVAVCMPRDSAGVMQSVEKSLRLENYLSVSNNVPGQRLLTTSMARLLPDDLPAQALSYCAYDMVVLAPGALAGLRERQTQALCRWVAAGGSLCVFAGRDLTSEQCQALNAVAGVPDAYSPSAQALTTQFYHGLGRTMIVADGLDSDIAVDSESWRRIVSFLWKLRPQVAEVLIGKGRVNLMHDLRLAGEASPLANVNAVNAYAQATAVNPMPMAFTVQPDLSDVTQLAMELQPMDMRILPFPLILGILLLYVVLIGPVDWWVLGWFKFRRYTWVLFPVITLAITVSTVLLADRYMGRHDRLRALVIMDLAADGTVLRKNRIELALVGRDKTLHTELRHALWSFLPIRSGHYWQTANDAVAGYTTPLLDGTYPLQYRVSIACRQWLPVLMRTFDMDPAEKGLPFDITFMNQALKIGGAPRSLRTEGLTCVVFTKEDNVNSMMHYAGRMRHKRLEQPVEDDLSRQTLRRVCLSPGNGIFALVTQLSPTGGANLEDLILREGMHDSQALCVVLARAGDDIVMYRRFDHGKK